MNIKSMTAVLDTIEIETTAQFYRQALGFEKTRQACDDHGRVYWMHLRLNRIELMLYQSDQPEVHRLKKEEGFYDTVFYYEVEDVKTLRRSLKQKGLPVSDLEKTHYGTLEFYLRDPDGHQLTFSQDLPAPTPKHLKSHPQ